MAVSRELEAKLRDAATSFTTEITGLVSKEVATGVRLQVRRMLGELQAGGNGQPRGVASHGAKTKVPNDGKAAPRKSAPGQYDAGAINKLVGVIKAAGGTALPNHVSKVMRLSPFQRRQLVDAAVKSGKVKTRGNRRSSIYVLPGTKSGKR